MTWNHAVVSSILFCVPDSKVRGANMGPIWGQQDPRGPQVGLINFAICDYLIALYYSSYKIQMIDLFILFLIFFLLNFMIDSMLLMWLWRTWLKKKIIGKSLQNKTKKLTPMLQNTFSIAISLLDYACNLFCCGDITRSYWFYVTNFPYFQGCFTGTGAIIWLPQCQWSNPEGYV